MSRILPPSATNESIATGSRYPPEDATRKHVWMSSPQKMTISVSILLPPSTMWGKVIADAFPNDLFGKLLEA